MSAGAIRWARVIGGVAAALALIRLGMYIESLHTGHIRIEFAEYKAQVAQEKVHAAADALAALSAASVQLRAAADRAAVANVSLKPELNAIRKELKHATPLPVDCRPDAGRMRQLASAIDATNHAATGQPAR